ncbi:flagellar motor protein MotB [Ferviditalea candida]|uniref:Flagellar motor protein MotB n=1 Tax=Ferviditalea candida TaxID=3108399 RepID=A0ABU5ZHA5_9BACL|nr:flagellar motor protein MotB [Paenibacillaceae bacterium T2]
MKKRRKPHNEEHADETWLIPYADLLTLLLALFIVLFATSKIDLKKFDEMMISFNSVLSGGTGLFEKSTVVPIGTDTAQKAKIEVKDNTLRKEQAEKLQKEMQDLQNLKKKIDAYIDKNGLNSQLQTTLNSQQLVLKISDNALFPSGSANVKPEAQKLASNISVLLEQYPQYEVIVSGHTDNRPIHTAEFESNWDLSTARALNFMKILIQDNNLDKKRFSAVGYGEFRPVESNDTEEGRAKNRRVEVSIFRNLNLEPDKTIQVGN